MSVVINIGLLGVFKYYNFFIDSFVAAFSLFGAEIQPYSLKLILPVGISFYTFQTMSYTIDVYRRQLSPTGDFIAFTAFVSFFPQLVAGPIERATHLLPQFYRPRHFNYSYAVDGLRQMLWGFFKKVVIADNSGLYANLIFNDSSEYSGSTLLVGAIFFSFQIYGDFSGYSDIATGTSKLFGFDLMQNFNYPYFSRDIAEFWRRWHISLSTWFRDYLYIPLGGSRVGKWMQIRNTFIVFIISGFWHGANWTFIAWGLLNALFFLPLLLANVHRANMSIPAEGRYLPTMKELFQILTTYLLTVLAWVFFRCASLSHAWEYLSGIFSLSLFSVPQFSGQNGGLLTTLLIGFFVIIEWQGRSGRYAIEKLFANNRSIRWGFYYGLIVGIVVSFLVSVPQDFIYFQF